MKSYDDLQRFKEKTQTNHIEFKDMSEQAINSDSTNWAIIKQLLNEGAGSVLDNRQRIDLAAPQPIDSAAFSPRQRKCLRWRHIYRSTLMLRPRQWLTIRSAPRCSTVFPPRCRRLKSQQRSPSLRRHR
ncbi:cellulose biosynthesis protein BcsO [Erwinia aphidicola]|uniref:cellulose biosynthesis protein BcsO n=1 Tax=Erwinia aphidicola TaxID=68334 RepID=UPI0030D4E18A